MQALDPSLSAGQTVALVGVCIALIEVIRQLVPMLRRPSAAGEAGRFDVARLSELERSQLTETLALARDTRDIARQQLEALRRIETALDRQD